MIENDSVKIDRKRLIIKPNNVVNYNGSKYRIINILNSEEVVISNLESARCIQVNIRNLSVVDSEDNETSMLNKGEDISDEAWQVALQHYEIIKPLIENSTVETVKRLLKK